MHGAECGSLTRACEMSGLGLRLAHKKGRDIFFKFGYAAGDEAYAPHYAPTGATA